jgi:hypothetical protein
MALKMFDMEALIQETKDKRLQHLEEQAMSALKVAVRARPHPRALAPPRPRAPALPRSRAPAPPRPPLR